MSIHENTVEYAVRSMFKGKSLSAAAKSTAKKFHGYENMFLGPGIIEIDEHDLEEAIWDRLVEKVIGDMKRIREGKEHYALDGVIQFYRQDRFKKMRAELKERVVERLGHDPFVNDDKE